MPKVSPTDTNMLSVVTKFINTKKLKELYWEDNLEEIKIMIMWPMEVMDFISWELSAKNKLDMLMLKTTIRKHWKPIPPSGQLFKS